MELWFRCCGDETGETTDDQLEETIDALVVVMGARQLTFLELRVIDRKQER